MRKTYRQKWAQYNLSQQVEKSQFMALLGDLTSRLPTPPQAGAGRRLLPLKDQVYGLVFKTYSTVSGRRFTSDLKDAQGKGWLDAAPHYNSLFRYLQNPSMTPLLYQLVQVTSLPLRTVETTFAMDSSGFSTGRYHRWFDAKWGKPKSEAQWVKAHIMCGTKTNIITDVKITPAVGGDAPQAIPLIQHTAQNFQMAEVSADKAYSSRAIFDAAKDAGATAFIPFRENATGRSGGSFEWRRMFHLFEYKRDEFLQHYHARSNVETCFHMLKAKFGDFVRSKTPIAQENELLCKIICHNIVVVIHELHELGIQATFAPQSNSLPQNGPLRDN